MESLQIVTGYLFNTVHKEISMKISMIATVDETPHLTSSIKSMLLQHQDQEEVTLFNFIPYRKGLMSFEKGSELNVSEPVPPVLPITQSMNSDSDGSAVSTNPGLKVPGAAAVNSNVFKKPR
jgi:hypothetical protein